MNRIFTPKFPKSSFVYMFILIMLNVIVFVLLVSCLSIDKWFSQTWKIADIEYNYIGGLNFPNRNILIYCPPNSTLSTSDVLESNKISQSFIIPLCDYNRQYSECRDSCEDSCQKECDFVKTWAKGGYTFKFISVVVCVALAINTKIVIGSVASKNGKYFLIYTFWASGIVYTALAILQIVGFYYWVALEDLQFSGCSYSYPYSGVKPICGELASVLSIALTIAWPFLVGIYWMLIIKGIKDYKAKLYRITPVNVAAGDRLPLNESPSQSNEIANPLIVVCPPIQDSTPTRAPPRAPPSNRRRNK
ncbi:hypothetical protein SteCoe_33187 [Stentor coeruleus]|uniref:Uncharacterized protein n=1 Tax=Stentor coeruleus TaxID=5963 RepID=A0A1R2AXB4_9CILI|nr:hypothetical protein SteCoe_33187 [Stentor coeruleus]